ncbi:MAG: (5-formylfuran-3-yl)methyl phosphate synthase, partial [SAR202 cluster bacterium]|nr:(5-formylfuran-3-yl)methyl phosphate synthase [SAR202 cluster bacterium]
MTGMLASVASLEEAKTVLEHRVDIIDLKNTKLGALGQLDHNTISSVVELVNNQLPVSATIGDIEPNDLKLSNRIINIADLGVDFVKVGLLSKNIPNYFLDTINDCCRKNINIIIVIFAENFIGMDLLEALIKSNISGVMIDTKNKSSNNLCSLMRYKTLGQF